LRLSEDARRSVVFLGWQKAGPIDVAPIDPKGTGFLLHGGKSLGKVTFLATARHVAEKLHPPFVVRINKKGGGAGLVHFERPEDINWCYHPDDAVDLAVAPIDAPNWAEATALRADPIFGEDIALISNLDAGDVAWVVGLFHLHHGRQANVPVVHTGHIAVLPGDEPVAVGGKLVSAYLVQANAISGCSGSPVWACNTTFVTQDGERLVGGHGPVAFLLGVWSSSWKVEKSQIVAVRTDEDDRQGTAAPLGMGIVIPAARLGEILKGEQMTRARKELNQKTAAANSPTRDLVDQVGPTASDANLKR
jgi:hypothetical protein